MTCPLLFDLSPNSAARLSRRSHPAGGPPGCSRPGRVGSPPVRSRCEARFSTAPSVPPPRSPCPTKPGLAVSRHKVGGGTRTTVGAKGGAEQNDEPWHCSHAGRAADRLSGPNKKETLMAIQARGASTCLPRSRSITVIMGLGLVGALLTTVPSAAAIDENMVVNPGFEEGTSGWSASGGTFTVSDDAASGDHSGALTDRNEFYEGIRGTLTDPLAHDGHYRIEAEIKHDGSASEP